MNKFSTPILSIAMAGLVTSTGAQAWFANTNTPLVNNIPVVFQNVKGNASGNPDFGGQAWAMHGKWASFNATRGRTVTITLQTTTTGGSGNFASVANPMHPALTVWRRPLGSRTYAVPPIGVNPPTINTLQFAANTAAPGGYLYNDLRTTNDAAPKKAYLVDHNFIPTNSFVMDNVKLEDGTEAGDVRMLHVGSVYDADRWTALRPISYDNNNYGLIAITDGVRGRLIYSFSPPETTNYQIFIGGYRPENGLNNNFDVRVTATNIN